MLLMIHMYTCNLIDSVLISCQVPFLLTFQLKDISDMVSMVISSEGIKCGTESQTQCLPLFTNDKPVTFCQFYGKEERIQQDFVNQEESNLAVRIQ